MVVYQDSINHQAEINNYLTSINNTMIEDTNIYGKLYFSDSSSDYENLLASDFKQGTFKYDNEICDGQKFLLGSTYSGRIEVGLYKDYNLQDLIGKSIAIVIKVRDKTRSDNARYFDIPFGTFEITEASQEQDYIKITAYDCFINGNENETSFYNGKFEHAPYVILNLFCNGSYTSGLGRYYNSTSHGYIDIDSLMPLDESGENPIKFKSNALNFLTQREIISDISQVLGCVSTVYRELSNGHWYDKTGSNNPSISNFRQYVIKKIGKDSVNININKIKDLKIASNAIHFDGVIMHVLDSVYTAGDVLSGGRIYEFTTKLMDDNTDWERQAIVDALWTNTLSLIDYTPVEIDYFGDPALEVGDEIIVPYKGSTIKSFISSIEYSLNGSQKIKCCEFNTVITADITNSTQKEQKRIMQMLAGKNKIIKIDKDDFDSTTIDIMNSAFYTSDTFEISEQNNFILQGILKIYAYDDTGIKITFQKRSDMQSTQWDTEQMKLEYQLKEGNNYINIFHCFEIKNLHNLNAVKMFFNTISWGSSSQCDIIEANLSLTGSII